MIATGMVLLRISDVATNFEFSVRVAFGSQTLLSGLRRRSGLCSLTASSACTQCGICCWIGW